MHWNILLHVESFMYYFPRDSHICPKNLVLYRSLNIMFSLGVQIAMFKVSALQPPSPLPSVMCTIVLILKIHKKNHQFCCTCILLQTLNLAEKCQFRELFPRPPPMTLGQVLLIWLRNILSQFSLSMSLLSSERFNGSGGSRPRFATEGMKSNE